MVRTFALLAAMTALFGVVGYLIGGQQGILLALIFAAVTNGFAFWNSDKAVLRMQGARPIGQGDSPDLHSMTKELADNAGLPMPALYIIDTEQPNAFATGRNPDNAAVAVTRGLLQHMNRDQVAGVIAHELAHIKNRDTLLMTVTATLAGAIATLANFAMFFGGRDRQMGIIGVIALAILSPLAAAVVQGAISRTREYEADAEGAAISGNPLGLASALEVLGRLSGRIDNPRAERSPTTAHMFIVNPLHMHAHDSLFSTHPPVEKRIAALRELAGGQAQTRPTSQRAGPWS